MTVASIREIVQRELYRKQKRLKIVLGNAERRTGVTQAELDNINRKLACIDWLIPLVNKANDDE